MTNIIIASTNKLQMRVWIDVLSPHYKLTYVDNIKFAISKNKQFESTELVVLDVEFIDEKHTLAAICQKLNKVIIVGNAFTHTEQIEFINQGAWGCSDISIEKHLILRTVESVMNNEIWLKRQLIPEMLKGILEEQKLVVNKQKTTNDIFTKMTQLTQREIEVIKHVYDGAENTFIAGKLEISMRTVKAHLTSIYRKLNVVDRFQLVVFLKDMQVSKISNAERSVDDDSNH